MYTHSPIRQRPLLLAREQLRLNLAQAAEHLERYHRDVSRHQEWQHCRTRLQEVAGCLTLLDLPAAARLAAEMLELLEAIGDPGGRKHEQGCELLVAATLFLPRYLEYARTRGRETPALLLPTINLLRFMRRAGLIPEHAFVSHSIPVPALPDPGAGTPPAPALAHRQRPLRQRYQAGLLGVLRHRALPIQLRFMAQAIEQLQGLCGAQPFNELWQLTLGLLEAVLDGGLELSNSVKHTFGTVDRQLRALEEQGAALLARPLDAALRAQLLYYLAKANPAGPRVRDLQARYQLDGCVMDDHELALQRHRLQTPDSDATQAVAAQLLVELDIVQQGIMALSAPTPPADLRPLALRLDQIALTLEMLELHTALRQCRELARRLLASATATDLQALAELLAGIEATLQAYALGVPAETLNQERLAAFSGAERQALQAARQAIASCKEPLNRYLDPYATGFGQAQQVPPILERLHEIQGALQLLQLDALADTLPPLTRCLEHCRQQGRPPLPAEVEALTEAIAGVEWFLEDYEDHRGQDQRTPVATGSRDAPTPLA